MEQIYIEILSGIGFVLWFWFGFGFFMPLFDERLLKLFPFPWKLILRNLEEG